MYFGYLCNSFVCKLYVKVFIIKIIIVFFFSKYKISSL